MKIVDRIKEDLLCNVLSIEDIDKVLEKEKYYPVEVDEEDNEERNFLKYTNNKSKILVYYHIEEDNNLIVENVTMGTKKTGNTKVRAFRSTEEIKSMMDWFRDNERYDDFLTFMLGLFLARRVGDTLSLKWSDFYFENGRKKEILNTLLEDKTGKIINMHITDTVFRYLDWYCEKKGINPIEHWNEDIFKSKYKEELPVNYTNAQYEKAIKKQSGAYRYQFKKASDELGIYGVSTHSTRKSFGRIAHDINKFDPDCLPTLQSVLGHGSVETTKIYIDIMEEKAEKMFYDVSKYIEDIDNGVNPIIDNTPVIALKTDDLRKVLITAFKMGKNNNDEMEALDKLITLVEEIRVS